MKMPFGKYKGWNINTIPENYLRWLWDEVELRGQLYAEVEAVLSNAVVSMPHSEIHSIYRELSFKWHPDRGGNLQAMQAVNEFYARLCAMSKS